MTEMSGDDGVLSLRDAIEINALNKCEEANAVATSVSYMQKLMHSDSSAHSESESALSASTSDSK